MATIRSHADPPHHAEAATKELERFQQVLGDDWLKQAASAVLQVPSAIVETDSNYLLNPQHPDFRSIRMARPQPFEFDLRLVPIRP